LCNNEIDEKLNRRKCRFQINQIRTGCRSGEFLLLFTHYYYYYYYVRMWCYLIGDDGSGGNFMTPRSMKKSFRESFRKLRSSKRRPHLPRRLSNFSQRVSNLALVRRLSQRNSRSLDTKLEEVKTEQSSSTYKT